MSERGQYGQASSQAPSSLTKWIFGGIGVGVVALIARGAMKDAKEFSTRISAYKSKHPGLKPGMSQAQQDAYWDAYYAKHGYPDDLPTRFRK